MTFTHAIVIPHTSSELTVFGAKLTMASKCSCLNSEEMVEMTDASMQFCRFALSRLKSGALSDIHIHLQAS